MNGYPLTARPRRSASPTSPRGRWATWFYVSLPAEGASVTAEEPCGEVESTKSVSDLYSPVDGEVTEVNGDLEDDPGLVNADPYGAGWMFKVRLAAGSGDDGLPPGLLTPADYEELTKDGD